MGEGRGDISPGRRKQGAQNSPNKNAFNEERQKYDKVW